MLFAQNVFGKVAGIFFVVCLIGFVGFYGFIVVKGMITKIKQRKKLKDDEKRLGNKDDDEKAKKTPVKDKK